MSIEDHISNRRRSEKLEALSPELRKAKEKANTIRLQYTPRMDDFKDIYGPETVSADKERVIDTARKFSQEAPEQKYAKDLSNILEIVIFRHGEMSDWLGPNAEMILSTPYDDIVNGVDMITRFDTDQGSRHLALAVDVTFSKQAQSKKFARIKEELSGKRPVCEVKYYEDDNQKGKLKNLPRSIIFLPRQTAEQIARLWVNGYKDKLGDHPVQFLIMAQLEKQLGAFTKYAERNGSTLLRKKYATAHAIVSEILSNRTGDMTHEQCDGLQDMLQHPGQKIFEQEVSYIKTT